jgi:hypothetical protein
MVYFFVHSEGRTFLPSSASSPLLLSMEAPEPPSHATPSDDGKILLEANDAYFRR